MVDLPDVAFKVQSYRVCVEGVIDAIPGQVRQQNTGGATLTQSWIFVYVKRIISEVLRIILFWVVLCFKWSSKRNSLTTHLGMGICTHYLAQVYSKLAQGHFLQTFMSFRKCHFKDHVYLDKSFLDGTVFALAFFELWGRTNWHPVSNTQRHNWSNTGKRYTLSCRPTLYFVTTIIHQMYNGIFICTPYMVHTIYSASPHIFLPPSFPPK